MKVFMRIFLVSILSLPAQANESKNYFFMHKGEKIRVTMSKDHKGVLLSNPCVNCLARKVYDSASKISQLKNVSEGRDAAMYCKLFDGELLVLKEELSGGDTEFCVFSDYSMIDAWELHNHHSSKKS